jgi:hypothetical protein
MSMAPIVRLVALVAALYAAGVTSAIAQAPPLVFTVTVSEKAPSETTLRASTAIEERGLALWSGNAQDFGVGIDLVGPKWGVHSITSMRSLPAGSHLRPTFQQVEVVRSLFLADALSVAGGGGIREEWDGTRVLVGRVVAGASLGRGRLQGSLVLERAVSSPIRRDAADIVTSVGWSRRIGRRLALGVEGIGQDLEGFWDAAEADGGARLLVGPSLHFETTGGWSASAIVGPVVHSTSPTRPTSFSGTPVEGGSHLGVFASASWWSSMRRAPRDVR